jgi:hypothetical protein
MNSIQWHKSYRKYKSENGRTQTYEYIRGGIRYHGGVSITCRSITPAVIPIYRLGKRYEPVVKISVKNSLTIAIKHVRQHVAQRKVVWVNKIFVTTRKYEKICL